MVKMNAAQLRRGKRSTANRLQQDAVSCKQEAIYIILDNVLDTYNIGSIFRLADAVGAKKVYLCGATNTPPNPRIKKASINTTEWVDWEYKETAVEVIKELRQQFANRLLTTANSKAVSSKQTADSIQVIAVEQSDKSIPYNKFEYKLPIALVVGHETYGVSKEVLKVVDGVVEIPMFGVNVSLNVMVSLAIVLFKAIEKTILF